MRTDRAGAACFPIVLAALAATACSKNGATAADGGSAATTAPPASGSYSSGGKDSGGASAGDGASPGACRLDVAPFVIDKGVRSETGITLVRLDDGRVAAGYASGEGKPKVAVLLAEGTATLVDVDISGLPELAQKPAPKTLRYVHRVTPLGMEGTKMRAAVDVTEINPDGTRKVACGPADDEEGLLHFAGVSAYEPGDAGSPPSGPELRECRSFSSGGVLWALGALAATLAAPAGLVESSWMAAGSVEPFADRGPTDGGRETSDAGTVGTVRALAPRMPWYLLLEHQVVPPEAGRALPRAGQVERFGYTQLTALRLGDAGFLLGARSNGKLRLTRRQASWEPMATDEITDFWYGSPVGLAALAASDTKVVVLAPLAAKLDLYGATFAPDAKIPKPVKIALDDPPGAAPLPPDAERTSVTVAVASQGKVIAAFLDGKSGKRRPRFAFFDQNLEPQGPAFEPLTTGDADVADIKLIILPDDRVMVAALVARPGAGLALEAAVVGCGLIPANPPPASPGDL